MNYYNENDPHAANWLRQLIKDGHLPDGYVDNRSICEVSGSDLAGFTQCHFFAGIGGWSLALQLAGWAEDRPVWTGSCPCQPFSSAGKGKGVEDERHLWPVFLELIGQCGPAVVFGEQVASKAGRSWLSGVRTDLEALAYGVGALDLCAAGVNAPHIRQRIWWTGIQSRLPDSKRPRLEGSDPTGHHPQGHGQGASRPIGQGSGNTVPSLRDSGVEISGHGSGGTERSPATGHHPQAERPTRADASVRPSVPSGLGNSPSIGQCGGSEDSAGQIGRAHV